MEYAHFRGSIRSKLTMDATKSMNLYFQVSGLAPDGIGKKEYENPEVDISK